MNVWLKLLLSLLIGLIGLLVAIFVQAKWGINNLLLFGLMVFVVTFIISLFIKKNYVIVYG